MRISQFSHKTTFIAIILIAILGFAVYSNSLNGEFIWDDYDLAIKLGHKVHPEFLKLLEKYQKP